MEKLQKTSILSRFMAEIITKIVEKISSYQLFNYFFPGIVFHFVVDQTMTFKIAPEDIMYRLFVYYITGMILSRVGSIIIEPIFKKLVWVIYARYTNYLDAQSKDSKIELLVLENNTYRTLVATFFSLSLLYLIDQIEWLHDKYLHPIAIICYLIFFALLFSLAYRKQTAFIRKNVHKDLELNDKEEIENLKQEQKNINIWRQII